jgi:hypothetical protein
MQRPACRNLLLVWIVVVVNNNDSCEEKRKRCTVRVRVQTQTTAVRSTVLLLLVLYYQQNKANRRWCVGCMALEVEKCECVRVPVRPCRVVDRRMTISQPMTMTRSNSLWPGTRRMSGFRDGLRWFYLVHSFRIRLAGSRHFAECPRSNSLILAWPKTLFRYMRGKPKEFASFWIWGSTGAT